MHQLKQFDKMLKVGTEVAYSVPGAEEVIS